LFWAQFNLLNADIWIIFLYAPVATGFIIIDIDRGSCGPLSLANSVSRMNGRLVIIVIFQACDSSIGKQIIGS
jgi:hypothetical protein